MAAILPPFLPMLVSALCFQAKPLQYIGLFPHSTVSLVPYLLPDSSEPSRPETGTLFVLMVPFIQDQGKIPLASSPLPPSGQLAHTCPSGKGLSRKSCLAAP